MGASPSQPTIPQCNHVLDTTNLAQVNYSGHSNLDQNEIDAHTFPPPAHSFRDDKHQSFDIWLKNVKEKKPHCLPTPEKKTLYVIRFPDRSKEATVAMQKYSNSAMADANYNFQNRKPMIPSITRYLDAYFYGLTVRNLDLGLIHHNVVISENGQSLILELYCQIGNEDESLGTIFGRLDNNGIWELSTWS